MRKIIVNEPDGEQRLIELGVGGKYFDDSLIIWDSEKDEPLTKTQLECIGCLDNDLNFSQSIKDARDLRIAANADIIRANNISSLRLSLETFDSKTAAQKWDLVKKLIEVL